MMNQVFESDNISFVKVSEELLPDYLTMVNDKATAWWIGHLTEPFSEEAEIEWIRQKIEDKALIWSMIEKQTGRFIGNIEIMDLHDAVGELGISITPGMQEKGYGTEAIRALTEYAFKCLKLKRIFLKAYPENTRAIHVYEKCGFREYDRNDADVFMELWNSCKS